MRVNARNFKRTAIGAMGACLMLALAATGPNVSAQNAPAGPGRFGRDFGLEGRFNGGKVVTGAPYSAQVVTERSQTLADGNTIHTSTTATVYRDNQGRTRREQVVSSIGPWAAQGTPRKLILIADPVAGVRTELNATTMVARQMPFRARQGSENPARNGAQKPDDPNIKTESLGQQEIGGLTAEGTRITRTIPAGKMGNQLPLVIVVERWYSPDLQTDLMRKETNPQFGQTTIQLTNISRTEPDAALFQVPSNYTVQSGRPAPTE